MFYLENDEFPGCCGIRVLNEFPDVYGEDFGKRDIDYLVEEMENKKAGETGSELNLIALTDQQLKDGLSAPVRRAGYKKLVRFRNRKSGHYVTLFGGIDPSNDLPAWKPAPKSTPLMER